MKKILLTGGLGYIGSHTVIELIEQNYEVIIADDLSNSEESALEGINSICGIKPEWFNIDLSDSHKSDNFFKKQEFDGMD